MDFFYIREIAIFGDFYTWNPRIWDSFSRGLFSRVGHVTYVVSYGPGGDNPKNQEWRHYICTASGICIELKFSMECHSCKNMKCKLRMSSWIQVQLYFQMNIQHSLLAPHFVVFPSFLTTIPSFFHTPPQIQLFAETSPFPVFYWKPSSFLAKTFQNFGY